MIQLIASDLDGTLLQGTTKVDPAVFTEIRRLQKKGILFAAASGRQYYNLQNLFAPVKDEIAYICENGALTIYHGEILNRVELPAETARTIIRRIEAEPGTEVLVSGTYTTYIHPKEPLFEDYIRKLGNRYQVVPDLLQIREPYVKLALFENAGTESRQRQPYWQSQFPEPVKVVTSGAKWLDILFPSMHKGVGMKTLQEKLGIGPQECLAFGDNYNDVEMFEACGTKVAVASAKEGIRAFCDEVTPTVLAYLQRL